MIVSLYRCDHSKMLNQTRILQTKAQLLFYQTKNAPYNSMQKQILHTEMALGVKISSSPLEKMAAISQTREN